jgi:hypothetical protein
MALPSISFKPAIVASRVTTVSRNSPAKPPAMPERIKAV